MKPKDSLAYHTSRDKRNIKLLIAFDGSNYSGWQKQRNAKTIQGTLEKCLEVMVDSTVTLHGSGRTDAGVHALGMVANFETLSSIPCDGFLNGLNSMLPKDIRILKVEDEESSFHSRYNAAGKWYRYDICTAQIQNPTERLYCTHYPGQINIDSIRHCLDTIIGSHDFSSFEGSGSRDLTEDNSRGAVRTIFNADIASHPVKSETYTFSFVGDGFLRHMVRNLIGTLMEVGKGKCTPAEFETILRNRDRKTAGPTAPAHGLFMVQVFYDVKALEQYKKFRPQPTDVYNK